MNKNKIKWKGHSAAELSEYHCNGYVYYLGDTGDFRDGIDCWCITRTPDVVKKVKKFKTYKEMRDYLFPWKEFRGSKSEDDFKLDIRFNCSSVNGSTLLSYWAFDEPKKTHKYAIDLEKKEMWEYFERERVSPIFFHEKEARDWADENLPREKDIYTEQLSFEDMLGGSHE